MIVAILAAQLALQQVAVIDGDTIRDGKRTQEYRLYGIDAPETGRAKCDAERTQGEAAAARLAELIEGADRIEAVPAWDPKGRKDWPTDGFKRRITRVNVDGRDVGEILVAEGLAKPWDGEGEHPDWCSGAPSGN